MTGAGRSFSYTADRRAYYGFVAPWVVLMLLEGGGFAVLIAALVPGLLKLALLGGLAGLILLVVGGELLAPLWTKHRLTETHLRLRYGRDRFEVPRAALIAAEPVRERLDPPYRSPTRLDPTRERLEMAFSEDGQVLLHLDRPRALPGARIAASVDRILLNVDRRDDFLAALALPASPPTTAAKNHRDAITAPEAQPIAPASPGRAREPAIRVEGLACRYGDRLAVVGLDLAVAPGEIYGFLGPNGAGKTTAIKTLVGLLAPIAGRVAVAGHDIASDELAAKAALGYVPDRAILYERLTGREFLGFLAQLPRLPRADAEARIADLLGLLDLTDRADEPCGGYSFGMKRKLALAGALLHRAPVLILDESLNGLDPRSVRRVKDLLLELADGGTAVLLSTHHLAVAAAVCHRVGILHRGRLVTEGSAPELRHLAAAPDLAAVFLDLTAEPAGAAA